MLIALLLAGAVGGGPELEDKATPVDLPVDRVMVFSDRARVTRVGHVKFGAGILRAPDLPGAVMPGTVRVTATGAKVVRVETKPVQRERWSIEQVDQWMTDLENVGDKIALAQNKLQVVRNELAMMSNLDAAAPPPEKDRLGKANAVLAPDAWRSLLDHLAQRRAQARASEKNLEREIREMQKTWDKARREVQKRNIGAFTDMKLEVLVLVEAERAEGDVSVEYFVPGASWVPAYDLQFDPDAKRVELQASGLVSQATGEDWPKAKIALSTAMPGTGIDMPELQTWALGDDREWLPRYSARQPPRRERPFQPPPPKPRLEEIERDADRQLLQSWSSQLVAMASAGQAPRVTTATTTINFNDDTITGDLLRPDGDSNAVGPGGYGGGVGSATRAPYPAPAMPAPPPKMSRPPMREEYEKKEADDEAPAAMPASESVEATGGEASVVGSAVSGVKHLVAGKQARSVGMSIGAEPIPTRQLYVVTDAMLPALTAGGLDYVYEAPVPSTIPSQANHLRVPLAARNYDVSTFYEASPALATTAYLKATVKNGSKLPILAGPANIFVKKTFAGDAVLATTGPGGVLELPLGADEDIRLQRTVIPSTKTQGLIFSDDVTDYVVTIDVGNYKKHAVTVRVIDQIPKTNNEKIKVELVSTSPATVDEKPNGDGLLYWHVDLAAGATKKIAFTYRVTRPKDWRLTQ